MSTCPNCARVCAEPEPVPDEGCAECGGEPFGRALADARRAWLYDAAFRALALARRYRAEEGPGGTRERECLAEVRRLRVLLAARRARGGTQGPGLARTSVADAELAPDSRERSG